jgi:hypothetical protein
MTKAESLLANLKARKDSFGDSKFAKARIWTAGNVVRIYTGHGNEFVQENTEGSFDRCKTNMAWGSEIDEAIEEVVG